VLTTSAARNQSRSNAQPEKGEKSEKLVEKTAKTARELERKLEKFAKRE
jgi:hypothetical protein